MATALATGLSKAKQAAQAATSTNKKLADLTRNTVDVHTHDLQTTDHGVRLENPDQWLRVVDDHKTGPSLLEDQIAREKVIDTRPRFFRCQTR